MHTTNYFDTFISVADDCPAKEGIVPPDKEPKTIPRIQYDMLNGKPYVYTSDDVIYQSSGKRKGITKKEFFSKGQACFRASPLTKKYGWGVHANGEGKIALFGVESDEYKSFSLDQDLAQAKAMRSKRKK